MKVVLISEFITVHST